MRCNACWRELESQAISTTCGHLLCAEDANKILNSDGACPICDQVLSKSLMRPVEMNPAEEWINLSMAGVSPQILMKATYKSIMFYIGQKELEMQYKMNNIVSQYRQKCEVMQAKFTEKMEEVHSAYQKMARKCQIMQKELENLTKDKQELQEKYSEKSRQKRKLDELYDQLRQEYESAKRSAIQPAKSFLRNQPDLFSGMGNMMQRDPPLRRDGSNLIPETPGRGEEAWAPPVRQTNTRSVLSGGPFELSGGSPVHTSRRSPVEAVSRMPPPRAGFGHSLSNAAGFGSGPNNPAATLRDLIFTPVNRPNQSRNHTNVFQL
ncbi:E3 ubiquitin-protein ligase CCNB1IP1 homolog isoform X1 [Carex rostrata]